MSTLYPFALDEIWYLYTSPLPMPGTNPSHMPDSSHLGLKGCEPLFQPFQLPMTETYSALGAQTAKRTPSFPSTEIKWEPSFSYILRCAPCLKR